MTIASWWWSYASILTITNQGNKMKTLKELPRGNYFKRSETSRKVYVKGHYSRTLKKWSCIAMDDHCFELFLKPETPVFFNFNY
jgi:hypothetical protein